MEVRMASKRRGALGVVFAFPFSVLAACTPITSSTAPASDGGTEDSSVPPSDSGAPPTDSAPAIDAAGACAPGNVQGYVPKWTPPKSPESACTQGQLTSYGNCLDSNDSTSAACAPWFGEDASANSTCKACVTDSQSTDPAWGPMVDVGTSGSDRQINVSGCLAILLHDSGSGCAGSFQALQECESAACANNCEGASSAALATCIEDSDNGGCSNYLAPAECI
jgi:hypothetical protein